MPSGVFLIGAIDFELGQATGRKLPGVRGVPNIFDAQKLLQGYRRVVKVNDADKTLGEATQVARTRRCVGFGNRSAGKGACVAGLRGNGRTTNKHRANVAEPSCQRDSADELD